MTDINTDNIIALVVLLISLSLILISVRAIVKSKQAEKWSATEGEVIKSEMTSNIDSGSEVSYNALIIYKYSVNGIEYYSSRIHFGSVFYSPARKRKNSSLLRKYRKSGKVKVYYNPEKMKESVLETAVLTELYWRLAIGIGIILFIGVIYCI